MDECSADGNSDGGSEADATIIIPQYERAELTVEVVRSLRKWERVRWPIVVVDDGSGPESVARVEQSCRNVSTLRQPHRGVTAAWNCGVRAASTPLVVLLNNDVQIQGAWVDALLHPLRTTGAALSGAELRRERAAPPSVLKRVGRSEFLAGWCWAFRRDDVLAIGGFDESLRLYFSDTDLQARLLQSERQSAEPAVVGGLPLLHAGHQSTRLLTERRAIWQQDRRRFIEKWTADRQ